MELKKKSLGVKIVRQALLERGDTKAMNDYIFMKLGTAVDLEGNNLDGYETIDTYIRNCEKSGLGFSWFSTKALHSGMDEKKVEYYNKLVKSGVKVSILFAIGEDVNDICYSASVLELVSSKNLIECPGEPESVPEEFGNDETGKVWIKITDIQEELDLQAVKFKMRSTHANLKKIISTSQFCFGYVYLSENK